MFPCLYPDLSTCFLHLLTSKPLFCRLGPHLFLNSKDSICRRLRIALPCSSLHLFHRSRTSPRSIFFQFLCFPLQHTHQSFRTAGHPKASKPNCRFHHSASHCKAYSTNSPAAGYCQNLFLLHSHRTFLGDLKLCCIIPAEESFQSMKESPVLLL